MQLSKPVQTIFIVFIIWLLFAGLVIYLTGSDNGLFAQIAIPVTLGIVHTVLCLRLLRVVFQMHPTQVSAAVKGLGIFFVFLSLFLAFRYVPVFNSVFN